MVAAPKFSFMIQPRMLTYLCLAILAFGCSEDDPNPTPDLPKLTAMDLEVDERDTDYKVILDFRIDKASEDVITGVVETVDLSATKGVDYKIAGTQIVFQPGSKIATLSIDILGDNEQEDDESFSVKIVELNGALIETSEVEVRILNDDSNSDITIPGEGYTSPMSYDGMTLIWQDEFSGESLNSDNWTFETGNGSSGWGNNESQYYRKENTSMYQGHAVIEAREENFSGFKYTSSRVITQNKFDFKYGRVDIRAALPYGQGIWPALWMLGSNFNTVGWPACGEIDIMEMIGGGNNDKTVHGTAHWAQGGQASHSGDYVLQSGSFQNEFHVFSIEWDDRSIKWYVDDNLYHELNTTPNELDEFRGEHFLIMNLAVGGNWPGYPDATTEFPQRLIVDYIRVFQNE